METASPDASAVPAPPAATHPPTTSSANSTVQFTPIASYSKLLRPLFNCSSKLGRSLCELFGLLVKLSAGSPWKNTNTRRNMIHHLQSSNPTPSQTAVNVATAIANISISGFSNQRFNSFCSTDSNVDEKPIPFASTETHSYLETLNPKFRLTFYICSLGFASSILFDDQKRPYHLMLQRFDQSGGLKSLFDAFHWAVSLLNPASGSTNESEAGVGNQLDRDKLQEGMCEF